MFPFWDDVIAPVIEAVGARRVVEIGALRGETTVKMLERLGPACELHVIDPLPQFDPADHERAFPGRYVFHLGISHDVLPTLPPSDVALVDGDHNWYTVHTELQMLAATAADAGAALPVLILHDVGWPYGRRDLYYEPWRIPAQYRQPYRRAGMRPGVSRLFPNGGMNLGLDNADHEGGERNGVMTALDDFIAEHDRPLRRIVLPVYYGLAIVAEEDRLAENSKLRDLFDFFDGPGGKEWLVGMGEHIRLDEAIFGQAWIRTLQQQLDRANRRYLDLVKAALLDEHYLDNELRVEYLLSTRGAGPVDPDALRDPARFLPVRFQRMTQTRASGAPSEKGRPSPYSAYTDAGRRHLDRLEAAVAAAHADGVTGDFAEISTGHGGGAMFLRACLEAYEITDRTVWVADPFRAVLLTPAATGDVPSGTGSDLNRVRDGFARFGLLDERVRFLHGEPTATLPDAPFDRLAVVRLGEGLGDTLGPLLELLAPRVQPGGFVFVAGTGDHDVERALTTAIAALRLPGVMERIDANSSVLRLPVDTTPAEPVESMGTPSLVASARAHPPIAPPAPAEVLALSVVVVFHNMRREAERTLHSLSRAYQRGVDDLDYEVIVIDNGSPRISGSTRHSLQASVPNSDS